MKTCSNCGAVINDNDKYCPECGTLAQEKWYEILLWGLIGFFIPFAGLIVYFLKRGHAPKSAKASLTGFIIMIVLYALWFILIFAAGMALHIG